MVGELDDTESFGKSEGKQNKRVKTEEGPPGKSPLSHHSAMPCLTNGEFPLWRGHSQARHQPETAQFL